MVRKSFAALLVSAALFLCFSCSSDTGVTEKSRTAPPDPSWVGAISMHSNGAKGWVPLGSLIEIFRSLPHFHTILAVSRHRGRARNPPVITTPAAPRHRPG